MGIIQAICISEVRGVQKHAIPEADLTPEWGIVGDAHGGKSGDFYFEEQEH